MAYGITHSTGALAPDTIDGYRAGRETRTIVHDILGREDAAVTYRPSALRSGVLKLVFRDELAAAAALDVLALPQLLTLTADDRPSVGMTFVVVRPGAELDLDAATRDVWVVNAPFREKTP